MFSLLFKTKQMMRRMRAKICRWMDRVLRALWRVWHSEVRTVPIGVSTTEAQHRNLRGLLWKSSQLSAVSLRIDPG